MANCDFLSPLGGEVELAVHTIVLSRATGGTGVVDGNRLSPHSAPNITVLVDLGRIRIAGATIDATSGVATIGAASATLCRIDLIIRTVTGTVQVIAGTATAIEDPDNTGDWHSYTLPSPNDTIPEGAILGAVFVASGVTSIGVNDIWMFAGKVEDWTDVTSAIALKHTQGTDQTIDSGGIYQSTASQIKGAVNHVGNLLNPHATTKTQLGLGNVVDYADVTSANAPKVHATSHISGTDILPAVVSGGASGLMTGADKTKLNGIAAGADVTGSNNPKAHAASHKGGGSDNLGSRGVLQGTGALQTIAHSLGIKPNMVSIVPYSANTSVSSLYADATNIYVIVSPVGIWFDWAAAYL